MNTKTLQNPEEWAVETFGAAELGDVRRTDRLIKLASALGENPSVSLPASMRNWAETHAAYQFLGNQAINHEQIMAPHLAATYQEWIHQAHLLLDPLPDSFLNLYVGSRFGTCAKRRRSEVPTVRMCLFSALERCADLLGQIEVIEQLFPDKRFVSQEFKTYKAASSNNWLHLPYRVSPRADSLWETILSDSQSGTPDDMSSN